MTYLIRTSLFAALLTFILAACNTARGPADELRLEPTGDHCDVELSNGDSIKGAIDNADPGATICLSAGEYTEPDALIIQEMHGMSLLGAGSDQVTIVREGGSYGLQVRQSDDVTLQGFTLSDADNSSFGYGLKLELSDGLHVQDVHATDNARTGIDLNTTDNAVLQDVVAIGNGGAGIAIRNSEGVNVSNAETESNSWGGLALWAPTGETLTNLEITDSTFSNEPVGIFAQHPGTFDAIHITGNSFAENAVQLVDETGVPALALEDILTENSFDRAAVVRSSSIQVPAIFSSIQDAIDAADASQTVEVLAGTYEEDLTVDVANLKLEGPNAGTPATEPRADEAVIEGLINVGANEDGVTIDGFTVEGRANLRGLEVTVSNNIFVGDGNQNGPATQSSAPDRANSFVISNNSLSNYNQALQLDGDAETSSLVVSGNHISNSARAIQTFASLHDGPVGDSEEEAGLIVDNTIVNNDEGIRLATGGFDVHRNVIDGNDGYGMRVGFTDSEGLTNATCNWWGAADGPSGYADGSGDGVIQEADEVVQFAPWSVTADAEEPCEGGLPVVTELEADPNPAPIDEDIEVDAELEGVLDITVVQYSLDGGATWEQVNTAGTEVTVKFTIDGEPEPTVLDVCVRGSYDGVTFGDAECILVAVFDPTAGFVTGGGWIESPEGAYVADPDLTGRANFGFVSRYQRGRSEPDGNTQFQFRAADLSFRSTSYDWLVISGHRAQFKGEGTINGSGDYGFLLTAIDSDLTPSTDVDKFRIKIWDRATDEIVYDNQMGKSDTGDDATELGGGSIMIHSGGGGGPNR